MTQPHVTPLNEPFWSAIAEGRLACQHCNTCGRHWLPAREACPDCLSADIGWREAKGPAKLVSWVVYHRALDQAFAAMVPYVVAIVELAEGARFYSNIIGADDPEKLRIDQKLKLEFIEREGVRLPCFRPA